MPSTTLDLEPYMMLRPPQPHYMELVRIISLHSTKDNGHYTAITKRGDEWTLFNNAIALQIPTLQVLQTQAYILMYRKTDPSVETMETEPKVGTQKQKGKLPAQGHLNPRPGKRQNKEIQVPQPDFLTQASHGQTSPRQERRDTGTYSEPIVETPRETQWEPETLFNPHITTPQVPEPEVSNEWRQLTEGSRDDNATTNIVDKMDNPQHLVKQPRQPQGGLTTHTQTHNTWWNS